MSCSLLSPCLSSQKRYTQLGWAGLGWAGWAGWAGGEWNGTTVKIPPDSPRRRSCLERESSGFGAKQDIDLAGLGTLYYNVRS